MSESLHREGGMLREAEKMRRVEPVRICHLAGRGEGDRWKDFIIEPLPQSASDVQCYFIEGYGLHYFQGLGVLGG